MGGTAEGSTSRPLDERLSVYLEVVGLLVRMEGRAGEEEIKAVVEQASRAGFRSRVIAGGRGCSVVLVGAGDIQAARAIEFMPAVESVTELFSPFKLSSRETKPDDSVVGVGGVEIGGSAVALIAGPCAVESREQITEAALAVKAAGAHILRGGAYKPRTSPYSFQGLAEKGLELLAEAGRIAGMPVVTEVVSPADVAAVARYSNMLQIGARNMQNFALLVAAGETGLPVLLKRGPSATIEEWLMAAEYLLLTGNDSVVLCERGIRTFESYTRNTLDLGAVALVRLLSHLPVVVDPSHGSGKWRLVTPLARAAVAVGANGIMVEVHPEPQKARSDGYQSLTPAEFAELVQQLGDQGRSAGCRKS